MANAILIVIMGIAAILFGLQDFFTKEDRRNGPAILRATTLMVMGLYLIYLFTEIEPSNGGGSPSMGLGGFH